MYRLDQKLAKIRAGNYAKGDFIIADAKDGDMSNPIPGTGNVLDANARFVRHRTRAEFLEMITSLIRQDILDIMLPTLREERRQSYAPLLPVSPVTGRVLQVPVEVVDAEAGIVRFEDHGEMVEHCIFGGQSKLQWKVD